MPPDKVDGAAVPPNSANDAPGYPDSMSASASALSAVLGRPLPTPGPAPGILEADLETSGGEALRKSLQAALKESPTPCVYVPAAGRISVAALQLFAAAARLASGGGRTLHVKGPGAPRLRDALHAAGLRGIQGLELAPDHASTGEMK